MTAACSAERITIPNQGAKGGLRLVQVSDCHLSADAETRYRGEDPDAGLQALVRSITAWGPQLLLATGDLSEDASATSYRRLAGHLGRVGVPICALPGNHDDDELMRQYFPCGPWDGPRFLTAGAWQIVLLKSSLHGRVDGVISRTDLQRLQQHLRTGSRGPVLLALHHHPVPAGSAWIDRHMLDSPEPLLQLISGHERIRGVVWGHVHQALEETCGRARLLACPSTAANSLSGTLRFELDPAGPACRWLRLGARGGLKTGLLFAGK